MKFNPIRHRKVSVNSVPMNQIAVKVYMKKLTTKCVFLTNLFRFAYCSMSSLQALAASGRVRLANKSYSVRSQSVRQTKRSPTANRLFCTWFGLNMFKRGPLNSSYIIITVTMQ